MRWAPQHCGSELLSTTQSAKPVEGVRPAEPRQPGQRLIGIRRPRDRSAKLCKAGLWPLWSSGQVLGIRRIVIIGVQLATSARPSVTVSAANLSNRLCGQTPTEPANATQERELFSGTLIHALALFPTTAPCVSSSVCASSANSQAPAYCASNGSSTAQKWFASTASDDAHENLTRASRKLLGGGKSVTV